MNHTLPDAASLFQSGVQPVRSEAPVRTVIHQNRILDLAPRDRVVFSPMQNAAFIVGVVVLVVGTVLFVRMRKAHIRHAQIPAMDRAFTSLSRLHSFDHAMQQRIRLIADELGLPALGLLVCPQALAAALEQTITDKPDRVWKRLATRVGATESIPKR